MNDCCVESLGDKDEQNPHLFICKCYSFSGIAGIICSVSLDLVIILPDTHSKGGSRSARCAGRWREPRTIISADREALSPSESPRTDPSHHFSRVKTREEEREGIKGNSFTELLIKTGMSSGILELKEKVIKSEVKR